MILQIILLPITHVLSFLNHDPIIKAVEVVKSFMDDASIFRFSLFQKKKKNCPGRSEIAHGAFKFFRALLCLVRRVFHIEAMSYIQSLTKTLLDRRLAKKST